VGWGEGRRQVTANPELKGVVLSGASALPQRIIEDAFQPQYGKTLNFKNFNGALMRLNTWCGPASPPSPPCKPRAPCSDWSSEEILEHTQPGLRTPSMGTQMPVLCPIRYEERGVFGQVTDADLSESGVCELKVQEAVVSKVS
jgi:hypothetical protein